MAQASPHFPVRENWLALVEEDVLAPEQPILDAHHHLWDRPEGRYVTADFLQDVRSGHDVRASLYAQCRTGYHSEGPEEMRPLGEVETIARWSAGQPDFPAGFIAFADLQLGAGVGPVLKALVETGDGKVRGIRNTTAFHPHPAVRSNSNPPPDGLLRSEAFGEGAREVAAAGLVLDVWAYQSQLDEVAALADAVPELTIVVDHCGGPLGTGPYKHDDRACFADWRARLAQLAERPNTRIKIGGFGLTVMGYGYALAKLPPCSERLAADWVPHVEACLESFGPKRAMFESNFPVDKGQFSYRTLWNAFKRLADGLGPDAREDLFWRSAARCYGVDEALFSTDTGRTKS
ncbi:amidohydrolase [Tropicimonas sp. IMCC6043]|uniref:amidohydrolase family protein n=1 Tax=Tropicimonas sp. IMCC6043 TaxID=2510645 RepID=UPI00101E1A7A|nr:amidohydrolase family protein [Tropicimonas sp. IMCC6043]RYH06569.1 amidohydrolase [Tropicimonas sp. IMCC6043]